MLIIPDKRRVVLYVIDTFFDAVDKSVRCSPEDATGMKILELVLRRRDSSPLLPHLVPETSVYLGRHREVGLSPV